ncbi:MAG: hypothetical protein RL385_3210, partial [Pseudomonadota bacterium]
MASPLAAHYQRQDAGLVPGRARRISLLAVMDVSRSKVSDATARYADGAAGA